MKILVLGGTGAMGSPLVKLLSADSTNQVYVVSRSPRLSTKDNIHYIQGDAFDQSFFMPLIKKKYDIVVDFMIWRPNALKKNLPFIMANCGQYLAAGTCSEYANTDNLITEETTRLYDLYSPEEQKQTYRYQIRKAVTDNLIINASQKNWTIFRPWVTYNVRKHPLVTVPESVWMWRYLNQKTIILPRGVLDKKCSLTYGDDAARAISKLIGNEKAIGEIVNIASDKSDTWANVIDLYQEILWELQGNIMKIYYLDDASVIWNSIPTQYDPIYNDRFFNRSFSTEKLDRICGEKFEFGDLRANLKRCIEAVLSDPQIMLDPPTPEYNGLMDRIAGEKTSLAAYPKDDKESESDYRRRYKIARSPYRSGIRRIYRRIMGRR